MHNDFYAPVDVRPELGELAPYVPGESREAFSRRTGIPPESVVKLNSNESPYDCAPLIAGALTGGGHLNHYPDTASTALRAALAAYAEVPADRIVVSHGSNELINLLWRIFLSAGDDIIACPPTFLLYKSAATLCGAHVVEVPRKADHDIDVDAIFQALTPKTKLIVLCSPNNPTGNPVDREDVLALLDTGRIVVVDEAYVEFSDDPRGLAHRVPDHRNLIVIRTFSKWAGLAGLRIGYGAFPDWIAAWMRRAQLPFEVSAMGHVAAVEVLRNLDRMRETVGKVIEERGRLFELLGRHACLRPLPSQGNFILTRVDERLGVERVRRAVESRGIMLRYFTGDPGLEHCMRITVGTPEHTAMIGQALATLG